VDVDTVRAPVDLRHPQKDQMYQLIRQAGAGGDVVMKRTYSLGALAKCETNLDVS
jgi:hypothetical protein